MSAWALDIELHHVGSRSDRPGTDTDAPHAQLGLGVDGKNGMHTFQRAPFNNVGRTADPDLFGRLEDDANAQRKIVDALEIRQCASQTERHGGVYVVAAGMHLAGNFGGIFQASNLSDRQGVDIGAEGQPA